MYTRLSILERMFSYQITSKCIHVRKSMLLLFKWTHRFNSLETGVYVLVTGRLGHISIPMCLVRVPPMTCQILIVVRRQALIISSRS